MTEESKLQADIIRALKARSFVALSTSVSATRGVRGVTKGVPDILVSADHWPVGAWLGLEVKTPKGALKTEQVELLERGRIVVVRSLEDALNAIELAGALWPK